MEVFFVAAFIGCGVSALIGFFIGELGDKGNGGTAAVLGLLLGPIGWIIAALLPPAKDSPAAKEAERIAGVASPERERLAKLEAELAFLRGKAESTKESRAPSISKTPGRDNADGTIPTYKLD